MITYKSRDYFSVGVYRSKIKTNIGSLYRTAHSFGANQIFTIGNRYQKQASDTSKAWKHIPLVNYIDIEDLIKHKSKGAVLIGVEIDDKAIPIIKFSHPEKAVYLLGAEDTGLPENILNLCDTIICIFGLYCLNVAVAGSIVLFDRLAKNVNNCYK